MRRPERGWDPVPHDHAATYCDREWAAGVREELMDAIEAWVGGLPGKRVLDLGGGPGQYSVAFAQRGADVTWYDVSARYRALACRKAEDAGVEVRFVLGYLDEAVTVLGRSFDCVFNRICWNYARGDESFSRVLWTLVAPGGVGYIDTTHDRFMRDSLSRGARCRTWLNSALSWKIGHPFPPRGRIAALFSKQPIEKLLVDYTSYENDRILFRKRA